MTPLGCFGKMLEVRSRKGQGNKPFCAGRQRAAYFLSAAARQKFKMIRVSAVGVPVPFSGSAGGVADGGAEDRV